MKMHLPVKETVRRKKMSYLLSWEQTEEHSLFVRLLAPSSSHLVFLFLLCTPVHPFRAEKRSAQASAHPLSQAQGGLFCVLTVFVCCWSSEWQSFWVKCTRCERLLPVKHFYLTCLLFFRRLQITLDSEQPTLKEKRIIPSVWGGIKGFEHF